VVTGWKRFIGCDGHNEISKTCLAFYFWTTDSLLICCYLVLHWSSALDRLRVVLVRAVTAWSLVWFICSYSCFWSLLLYFTRTKTTLTGLWFSRLQRMTHSAADLHTAVPRLKNSLIFQQISLETSVHCVLIVLAGSVLCSAVVQVILFCLQTVVAQSSERFHVIQKFIITASPSSNWSILTSCCVLIYIYISFNLLVDCRKHCTVW